MYLYKNKNFLFILIMLLGGGTFLYGMNSGAPASPQYSGTTKAYNAAESDFTKKCAAILYAKAETSRRAHYSDANFEEFRCDPISCPKAYGQYLAPDPLATPDVVPEDDLGFPVIINSNNFLNCCSLGVPKVIPEDKTLPENGGTRATKRPRFNEKVYTGEKPFVCDLDGCRYASAQLSNIIKHRRLHTGKKPFVCDFGGCPFASAQLSNLKTHKRIHTGEKPFVCNFNGCRYASAQKGDLTKHQRIHTGEKPYKCDFDWCTYAAARKSLLKTHEKKMHADAATQLSGKRKRDESEPAFEPMAYYQSKTKIYHQKFSTLGPQNANLTPQVALVLVPIGN